MRNPIIDFITGVKKVPILVFEKNDTGWEIKEIIGKEDKGDISFVWYGKRVIYPAASKNIFLKIRKNGKLVYLTTYIDGEFKKPVLDEKGVLTADGLSIDIQSALMVATIEGEKKYQTKIKDFMEKIKTMIPWFVLGLCFIMFIYGIVQIQGTVNELTKTTTKMQQQIDQNSKMFLNVTKTTYTVLDNLQKITDKQNKIVSKLQKQVV